MNKIISIVVISILIISGFGTIVIGKSRYDENKTIDFKKLFELKNIEEKNGHIQINFEGIKDYIEIPGSPRLPIYQKVIKLPGKVEIANIECSYDKSIEQIISKKILPTPQTIYRIISQDSINKQQYIENNDIYNTNIFYPMDLYEYHVKCGLDIDGKQTTYILLNVYPVRYNSYKKIISTISWFDIHIDYKETKALPKKSSLETYELVVIAPNKFSNNLQDFVTHKNSMGLTTILKTTDDIFSEYEGRDKPEQIKYFIKYAKENWDTNYILLFGGLKSYLYANDKDDQNQGSTAWHVPVRYTNIPESDEVGCISDLYYSDLYRYNEETQSWEFEDWDSDEDNVFADWSSIIGMGDKLDLIPDIYVGRLPCRNKIELSIIVDKIIEYESTSPEEKTWYRKMIGVTGKNFVLWQGQPDGEFLVNLSIENMSSRIDEVVRVYASNNLTGIGPVPDTDDIINEFSKGAGFIDFEGHGNPISWNTIRADGSYQNHDWHEGISITDIWDFSNGDKLPVVMVGGCHNGLFNVTFFKILLTDYAEHPNWYWTSYPTPLCFNWALVVKPNGGAIASIGATGLGPASGGDPNSLLGEIDNNFFYVVGQENVDKLGEGHSGAITKYVTENYMGQRETFTSTIFQLFGDPSLQLGGYT